jgi:predicted chitinase
MIKLTPEAMRQIFPNAPQDVLDAFVSKQGVLAKAGISATRTRLAYFFANIEHECGGFTIRNLTENLNYTAERMAAVWPNRFSSAGAVRARYGTSPGWQMRAFDDIYGNRMGNRPGTSDGSRYIGRGGPQVTGRDGYQEVGRRAGMDLVTSPELASSHAMQPEICAAFWSWKNLNGLADANNFDGLVKAWNGGTNGLADRKHLMAGNDPIIRRLEAVKDLEPVMAGLQRSPPPTVLPKPAPTIASPAKGSIGAAIASIFAAIFRRK